MDIKNLRVLVADDASLLPARKELREARDHAAEALEQEGARTERVSLKQLRRALEIYLAALGDGAGVSLSELLENAGVNLKGRRQWMDAARGRGDHTIPVLITATLERLNRHVPAARTQKAVAAARALREEVGQVLGDDGILLHQPHPRVAPRHGSTVGRAWVLTPAAVFNLLGLPVTQVPLGLNPKGLPLGVQVAAADGNDHLTIAAALVLERRFGGWVPPPEGVSSTTKGPGLTATPEFEEHRSRGRTTDPAPQADRDIDSEVPA